jgi:hypothetical protein
MPHGRATDGSDDERETDVRRLVATAVAEDTLDLLRTFEQEAGRHELAVTGAEAVIDALNRSAVEVLLVADGGTDRTVLVGADPTPLDAGDGARAPLVPAAVRAAVGTGARLRVVPRHGPLTDGIGALLRFPLTG